MDSSHVVDKQTQIVDLTINDKNAEDSKVPLKRENCLNREVAIYVISDEEWIRNLSEKEKNWYERNLTPTNEIETRNISCTSCFKQTNHKKFGEISRHPILGVPMCKNCKNFYFDGAWTKDDEGSFEFCGWCAQGGILMLCSDESCPNAFCKQCIKRNLGRTELTEIENSDDWKCFECKPKQIREQRALYYSIYKYWKANGVEEDRRKIRHQRIKNEAVNKNVVKMNFKRRSSGKEYPNNCNSDDTSHKNSSCSDDSQPTTSISQCLRYARQVSDLFSDGLKAEKKKWKRHAITDELGATEKLTWKHAKRVAKMVAIQNKNLDHLVELIVDNVSKECPNHDVEELKDIAKSKQDSSHDSLSYKDATSKEGINLEIDESISESICQNVENPDKSPSKEPKISLRKDIYDSQNCDKINENEEALDLPLYSPEQDSSSPTKIVQTVPPSHEHLKVDLLEASSAVPVITKNIKRVNTKTENNPSLEESHNNQIIDGHIPTFLELKKQLEQNVVVKETLPHNNTKDTYWTPKLHENNVTDSDSNSNKDDSSENRHSALKSNKLQKYKRIKRKKRIVHFVNSNGSSSEIDNSDDESRKLYLNRIILKKSNKNTLYEEAKAAVLATSSDNETCAKLPIFRISSENILKINNKSQISEQQEQYQTSLKPRIDDEHTDIIKDVKLNSKAYVNISRLSKHTLAKIQNHQKPDSIKTEQLTLLELKTNLTKTHKKCYNSINDREIVKLCNLQTLETFSAQGKNLTRTQKCESIRHKNLKDNRFLCNKENKCNQLSMSSEDTDSNNHSNVASDDKDNLDSISSNNGHDHKNGIVELARVAVLETSSSDETSKQMKVARSKKDMKFIAKTSRIEINDNNGTTNNENDSDRLAKRSEPKFLRVKLSESDESGDSEDAERTRRQRKKLEEEKRIAKQKRRIVSSDEDNTEDRDMQTSSKNENNKFANGNGVAERMRNSIEDQSSNMDGNDHESGSIHNNDSSHQSDSDAPLMKRTRKEKKKYQSSDSSTEELSDEEPRRKRKRKRIRNTSSSDEEKKDEDKDGPHKRKNIRKIIGDKKLSEDTQIAALDEKERKRRMEEKQKIYNELFETEEGEKIKELPLDFDQKTKEILVQVHPHLLKNMKPHQGRGIKFMWDAVFESKKDFLRNKIPGGAILAHCMGLGKTLQTIGLIHSVMVNFRDKMRCVLVLAPVNTLKNWVDEFQKWLSGPLADDLEVYEISGEKDNWGRADRLDMWKREGGVMIMGYDMFRNLTRENDKKFKKKQREIFKNTLIDPGPQMVVCDEGHVLKNTKSALNAAMNKISTKRRIILTGTPLQNNLSEYFAMVDFVKPKLLGTFNEFKNRFVNPIQNGQHSDSSDRDVRIMKKRSYILSDLLKGCMQRLDYNVLMPYLQPKHEYVLSICLTEFQKKLYTFYLKNYAQAGQIGAEGKLEGGKKGGLFYDVQNLSRVWNHPYILLMAKHRSDEKKMFEDDEEELNDFVVDGSDEEEDAKSTSEDDDIQSDNSDQVPINPKPLRAATRSTAKSYELVKGLDEVKRDELSADKGWWNQFLDLDCEEAPEVQLKKLSLGSKMILLMDILKEAETVGDKVLVFSQSLLSLDLIQEFLRTIDESNDKGGYGAGDMESYLGSWREGRDYYRMDGSTSPDVRKRWCNYFNKVSNHRMRLFLISTKAGGLGINLVAANRVIIFDASWNPAHDVQSIFRVYRFGQEKPVYIYRFLAKGTMEQKIYDRQVTKQSLSARVVDEQQIERHFTMNELAELYEYSDEKDESRDVPKVPKDLLLAELLNKHGSMIWSYHDHDSLLENQGDENLTEEERKAAWEEFENEKKGISNFAEVGELNPNLLMSNINPAQIQAQYKIQYPHLTDEQVIQATRAYIMQIQSGITRKPAYDKSHYQQEMAKAKAQQQMMYPGLYQRTNNTSNSRNNVQNLEQQQQQEYVQAQQIQQQYLKAQQAQLQALQRAALIQNLQQQVAKNQNKKQLPSTSSSTRRHQDELITLSSDEETGSNSGTALIDGEPEVQAVERSMPSSSTSRRGRPRLDPDTDDLLG